MRIAIGLYVAALAGYVGAARAQEFEVASVKPAPSLDSAQAMGQAKALDMMANLTAPGVIPVKGGRVSLQQRTLAQLIALAYQVKPADVTGPAWIADLRYNIEAKLPEGADPKSANAMMRRLLEDRFGVKTHTETKTTGGYALVVAKDGPKLKPTAQQAGDPDSGEAMRRMQAQMQTRMEELRKQSGGRPFSTWSSGDATMDKVAEAVGRMIKAPVANETGLTGKYEVEIALMSGESDDETAEYRMTQALAKLGLKLESRKAAVTLVVLDAASKTPTEN
jgi:uncharacterized protein (TIGR03435 family)